MWSDFSGRDFTAKALVPRIEELQWGEKPFSQNPYVLSPVGIVLHNTAAPTLAQWKESGPDHDARIRNLERYYEHELHWLGGPHWFVGRENITEFSNPLRRGTHSPSFNKDHLGIEMVGDYNREEFNTGDGAKVRDNAVFLMALLCRKFGWEPSKVIKLHREDPATDHDCPGRKVIKAQVIARVRAKMGELGDLPAPPPVAPEIALVVPPISEELRARMGEAILNYEARRDARGRLAIYKLPAGDGGGTYEVAGINDGYHPREAKNLASLIRNGKYDEAEVAAAEFMMDYTDVVNSWGVNDPGVQFFLRDCVFNRGPGGGARILQRALGVDDDSHVGPVTKAALVEALKEPAELLDKLRAARERYERVVVGRDEDSKFWRGLVNRWNKAVADARAFDVGATRVA